jgi:hypothetical protein
MSDALERRPEVRALTVEELVLRARTGEVRIPSFQRGLKWKAHDVVELFDSILKGYPIGSLLLWEHAAKADRIHVGPIIVDAPESGAAWWVVDGQQRLTALTVALTRPLPMPEPSDEFVIYFDAQANEFLAPSQKAGEGASWVPAPLLGDSANLYRWLLTWDGRTDEQWVDRVIEAGKRVREYVVPVYIIRTDDEDTLRQIFFRINGAGVGLEWADVHDALFGARGSQPTTLQDLSNELDGLGLGRPEEDTLLRCLFALRGLDPTRSPREVFQKHPDLVVDAAADALPALRRVLSFLRIDAGIPHLRLLPSATVLPPLTRFAALHPEPSARSRKLLARWVWRSLVGEASLDERTLLRGSIEQIGADEEDTLQRILALLPREAPAAIDLGERFDARAARTRLALLAMAHARPRDLRDGTEIDVAALIEAHDRAAFTPALSGRSKAKQRTAPWGRLLHPPLPSAALRAAIELAASDVLASHLISTQARAALARGDDDGFLSCRESDLRRAVRDTADRYAGWSRLDHDRPSIRHLLAKVNEEEAE